ncbi:MAG: SUMF1/EgtB/PvdO family nonheme iron enzyme, partial [Acetobacteraceae bacterium]|nr:SUMF1/EgtB/PvdO family nonheme iron enzyme [Acetobacteraceae bacterium]
MTSAFVIAILVCSGGANCEAVQAEPGISYPTVERCNAAVKDKAAALNALATQQQKDGKSASVVCLQEAAQQIREVEEPYDVLETAIVHAEPRVDSAYVGEVESGQRTLVTGLVTGSNWVRVLLPDGNTGFVYGGHLRKVGSGSKPAPTQPAAPPSPKPTPGAPAASSPIPPASLTDRAEFRDCPTCPVMVPLAGGSFIMGSNNDPSERPMHRVSIAPFAIGKFEVTVSEWNACVGGGGCSYKPTQSEDGGETRPMTNLSWDDAVQYVQWLGKLTGKPYRLPSEAEWEYAARAWTTTRYSWGDQPGTGRADCEGCGGPHNPHGPANVTAFPANPWGLFGMEGGVAEWVEDCWHRSYKGAPADGAPWRTATCTRHVLRGG